jgi:hypothetical protein
MVSNVSKKKVLDIVAICYDKQKVVCLTEKQQYTTLLQCSHSITEKQQYTTLLQGSHSITEKQQYTTLLQGSHLLLFLCY